MGIWSRRLGVVGGVCKYVDVECENWKCGRRAGVVGEMGQKSHHWVDRGGFS